jgi:hypothetical protein
MPDCEGLEVSPHFHRKILLPLLPLDDYGLFLVSRPGQWEEATRGGVGRAGNFAASLRLVLQGVLSSDLARDVRMSLNDARNTAIDMPLQV